MIILKEKGFTFDDILLVPQYSEVKSRANVDLSVELMEGLKLRVPVIAANMDTICEPEMVKAMQDAGGLGILHRYASFDTQISWFKELNSNYLIVPSVGISNKDVEFALSVFPKYGIKHVCVDVAHGDQSQVTDVTSILKQKGFSIIAGNVATQLGAERLMNYGASVVKVGVGPGSACSTRIVTGHGVPQAMAVYKASTGGLRRVIADGGLKNSGDIAKAIALGARAVMSGSLFAGAAEVPARGLLKYRGMASKEAQIDARGTVNNNMAEGKSFSFKENTPKSVKKIMEELEGGLRSAFAYSGAHNIKEFHENAEILLVSSHTAKENRPNFNE